ncbi:uncharacterized protein LOC143986803 [Lithobates pipiens]
MNACQRVTPIADPAYGEVPEKNLWGRRLRMNASQRAAVQFVDVAASFSEEEWERLEEWKRDLYGNVIRDIHGVMLDLGYHIENTEVLFRVISEDTPCKLELSKKGLGPDILLKIKYQEPSAPSGSVEGPGEGPQVMEMEPDFPPQIKQEQDSYDDVDVHHSYQHEDSKWFSTAGEVCSAPRPPATFCSEVEPAADTPSPHLLDSALGSPYTIEVKEEQEDNVPDNTETNAEETSSGLSPNKTRPLSKSPRVGEAQELATRDRSRRRKGIARQMKPVAALHDFDQNKQTEPKENEVPCVFSDCEVSFSGIQRSFPFEEICPYLSPVKGFREDALIGFQERGQAFILCSVCSKTFCNNSSFQVHMRSHTGERPFKCTDCDKSFIRSSHLKIHLRTHTGERPYKCTECEKSFRDNSSYARHQRIHTGEKPYQCSICGKYFRKKSNLKDHYRTHTGERPYKCQHCDKSFHQKSNLRVHQRNHHTDSCCLYEKLQMGAALLRFPACRDVQGSNNSHSVAENVCEEWEVAPAPSGESPEKRLWVWRLGMNACQRVTPIADPAYGEVPEKNLWGRRLRMNASQRAAVQFVDVAASFSEEEWERLEEWKRDLYGNVIRDIHGVMLDLGYHIENTEVLFRVISEDTPCKLELSKKGLGPDILLKIKYQEPSAPSGSVEGPGEGPQVMEMEPDFPPQIKQEQDSYDDVDVHHSYQHEDSKWFSTAGEVCSAPRPPATFCSEVEPAADTPSPHLLDSALGSPYTIEVKEEQEDNVPDNTETNAEETSSGLSPNKTRPLSKSPRVGEAQELATRDRSRRRKGIARQMKPVAALHDFDQNKQTEPKENEVPCVFSDCEVSFSGIQRSFPFEEICPYLSPVKGFREDALIGFQERGQAFILCSVCSKTFCNNSSFQVHMRSHTGERPFKCTDCDKSFIRSSHLKIHLRTHTGERPYKCTECEKSFRDNSSYARHQRIHTGEKPYQCSICGKYFRKKSNLKDHYRTHTGERPYKCQHCDKSFHQKSNLRVHQRNHHTDSC